jgi:hypothetical protein
MALVASPASRRGLALAMILAVVTMAGLSITSLYLMMQSGARRTAFLKADTEHLYLAEAVFANTINRLKKTTWDLRYYAQDKDPSRVSSEVTQGNYAGGEYTLVVSDVRSVGGVPRPNLVDLFLRMSYRDSVKNIVSRVRYTTPTVHRPTPYQTVRLSEVPQEVSQPAGQGSVAARFDADSQAQVDNRAMANVVVREARRLALRTGTPLPAAEIARALMEGDFRARATAEKATADSLASGDQALYGDGRAANYEQARIAFEAARTSAAAQSGSPDDYQANYPRALYGAARAYMGLAEAKANTLSDADDSDRPGRDGLLRLAQSALGEITGNFASSPIVPYAILQLAKLEVMLRPDDSGRAAAQARLQALKRYAAWYLWGEDRPILSDNPRNSVLNLAQMIYANNIYTVSQAPAPDSSWNVWGVALYGESDRESFQLGVVPDTDSIAPLPRRRKDLVAVSADGAKIGYRATFRAGNGTIEKVYTMDLDGGNVHEIADAAPTDAQSGWKPDWFAYWKAATTTYPQEDDGEQDVDDDEDELMTDPLADIGSRGIGSALRRLLLSLDNTVQLPGASPATRPGLIQALGTLAALTQLKAATQALLGGLGGDLSSPPAALLSLYSISSLLSARKQWEEAKKGFETRLAAAGAAAGSGQGAEEVKKQIDRLEDGVNKLFEAIKKCNEGKRKDVPKLAQEARRLMSNPPGGGGEKREGPGNPKPPKERGPKPENAEGEE